PAIPLRCTRSPKPWRTKTLAISCSRPMSRTPARASSTDIPTLLEQPPEAAQGLGHGLAPHRFAVAVEVEDLGLRVAGAALPGDPPGPPRLLRGAAARAGDAGDRDRDGGAGMHQRPGDHFQRGLAADRAVLLERLRAHAEHGLLGFVAVDHHAAVEPVRGPG